MRFTITIHARSGAPPDALELLLARLGDRRDDVLFSKTAKGIAARWRVETSIGSHEEQAEIGRRTVWEIVRDVADATPDLKAAWFAVSPQA
jgi:hypothetical protein